RRCSGSGIDTPVSRVMRGSRARRSASGTPRSYAAIASAARRTYAVSDTFRAFAARRTAPCAPGMKSTPISAASGFCPARAVGSAAISAFRDARQSVSLRPGVGIVSASVLLQRRNLRQLQHIGLFDGLLAAALQDPLDQLLQLHLSGR